LYRNAKTVVGMVTNKLRRASSTLLLLVLCQCLVTLARASPSLPYLISDHAIFQQGRKIHVWGTADPAEEITVALSQSKAATRADSTGEWSVDLPPMQAGGPFTLTVSGKTTLAIEDVLIGEVWVASGQSNMTFALADSATVTEELPHADYPEIHLFTVPRTLSLSAKTDTLPAAWLPCTPESAKEFSAVAYYFARDLHNKLHVPIGIIQSAWPGTTIEEWIAPQSGQRDPQIKSILDAWNDHEGNGASPIRRAADLEFDDFELLPDPTRTDQPLALSNFDDGSARNSYGGYWYYDRTKAPETTFELTAPGRGRKGFAAHVVGKIDASDDARLRLRFRQDLSPMDLTNFAGVRFWARGKGTFRFLSIQPTINDWDDYASILFRASADWAPVTIWFRDLRQEGWGVAHAFTPQSLTGFVIECFPESGYPIRPATALYNGMIAPLVAFPFRGVIWYQGESNALKAEEYRKLLPALIQGWRAESHQPDMQFLIVQLPNHGTIPNEPTDTAWARLREAQLITTKKLQNVGLAVTIDVGDPNDVHPHRKAEVGTRLALLALGTTYHQSIVYSGPMFESMSAEEHSVRIRFTNTGSGLVAEGGGALLGFAIAGKDRRFYWAAARIDGQAVIVSSPDVADPVAVRYAWADSPSCNLFNAEGLPASPFRTDDWPLSASAGVRQ
jgi:sialate O-acetylesterase